MNQDKLLLRKPIYQLKITLKEIEPPIWRRVLVSGNVSIKTIHKVIQIAMGWSNCFRIIEEKVWLEGVTISP